MKVLLNFFPVRAGGGQQVASNFLRIIGTNNYGHEWFIYVGEGSELHTMARRFFPSERILAIPYSYTKRFFNYSLLQRFVRNNSIDIVYNYAPVLPIKGIPQVVRSVYSNLYFPEIDFWKDYSLFQRTKKSLIDRLRLKGTLKADGLIFENESMQKRASELFNYPQSRTIYIEPSVTHFDKSEINVNNIVLETSNAFKVLYLSSWHLNKNIHILPEVASLLKINGIRVVFVLSLNREDPTIRAKLVTHINRFSVQEYFEFIGKVEARNVEYVVRHCDAMILLSKLECFSSNVIEAFTFEKPLIISDEIWSRSACHDAALYVDRENPENIAKRITHLVQNVEVRNNLTKKGSLMLIRYNSPSKKVEKQIEFLEYILDEYEKGD